MNYMLYMTLRHPLATALRDSPDCWHLKADSQQAGTGGPSLVGRIRVMRVSTRDSQAMRDNYHKYATYANITTVN